MIPHDWYLKTINKIFDVNGAYRGQCVSYFKNFNKEIGIPNWPQAIGGDGWAYNIWTRREALGYSQYYDFIQYTGPQCLQDGDWCVWGYGSPGAPYSHVAMFRLDNGNGTGIFLGENQGSIYVNQVNISYSGILGVLRYKKWDKPQASNGSVLNSIPSDFINEKATFTCSVDAIKIRQAPSLNGDDTGLRYEKGQSVNYDGYVKREGYVWISWISATTGTRRWMAAGELNSQGINVKPYGTFK